MPYVYRLYCTGLPSVPGNILDVQRYNRQYSIHDAGQRENDKLSGTTTCQRQKKDTDNHTKSRVEKDGLESDACDGPVQQRL